MLVTESLSLSLLILIYLLSLPAKVEKTCDFLTKLTLWALARCCQRSAILWQRKLDSKQRHFPDSSGAPLVAEPHAVASLFAVSNLTWLNTIGYRRGIGTLKEQSPLWLSRHVLALPPELAAHLLSLYIYLLTNVSCHVDFHQHIEWWPCVGTDRTADSFELSRFVDDFLSKVLDGWPFNWG